MRTVIAVAFLALATPAWAATVTPADAKSHVGEAVTVKGVANIYSPASGVIFVDLGGRGRDAPFTGFIPKSDASKFPGASAWTGKTVYVTGTVKLYHGKAEILVTDLRQIVVK